MITLLYNYIKKNIKKLIFSKKSKFNLLIILKNYIRYIQTKNSALTVALKLIKI